MFSTSFVTLSFGTALSFCITYNKFGIGINCDCFKLPAPSVALSSPLVKATSSIPLEPIIFGVFYVLL